ncbi:hypothetical protein CVT26_014647 [Gymnopilus dilepis]|uniref:Uncharacterized protein n=1 Tax=Gymnopilus dilepis TaxID=231916 RepID=A0A409W3K0_9AGAR|nr:hypothetical protein CVT26_014647 [Gymnopilus dilepis]
MSIPKYSKLDHTLYLGHTHARTSCIANDSLVHHRGIPMLPWDANPNQAHPTAMCMKAWETEQAE